MQRFLRLFASISILMTVISYAITHYPADALAFAPSIQIGRGSIRDIDWHPSGEMLTVDTVRGAWIYTDRLTDITHLEIQRAHFSPDGEWIAGVNEQHQIVLYDTPNFEPQITLSGHQDTVVQVEWHPTDSNRLASIGENGQLIVWNVGERKAVFRDKVLGGIRKMLWNPSGDYLAVMNELGGINVWDIGKGIVLISLDPFFDADFPFQTSTLFEFTWHDTEILSRAWSGDGSGTQSWNVVEVRQAARSSDLGIKRETITKIPSPAGNYLLVADFYGNGGYVLKVTLYDYAGVEQLQRLPDVSGWFNFAIWTLDSAKLVVWDYDNEFYTWDVAHNRLLGKNTIHNMIAERLSWRDDGNVIATGSEINEGHLWDAETGDHLAILTGQHERIHTLAWQPNGALLVTTGWGSGTTSNDNIVQIWDTAQINDAFEPLQILELDNMVANATWSSDGSNLAIAGSYQYIYIWNADQRTITRKFDMEQSTTPCCDRIQSVAWNLHDSLLFVQAYNGSVIIDAQFGQFVTYSPYITNGTTPTWTDQNKLIVARWQDRSLYQTLPATQISQVSDFANPAGAKRAEWTIPLQLTIATFDPSGDYLVGIDIDTSLVTWNLRDNEDELRLPDGFIHASFSPDSNLIAAYKTDNSVHIIHRNSGRRYGILSDTTLYYKNAIVFSPDSRRIAVVHDGVLTIYDSTPDCMASFFRPFFGGEAYCEGS